MSGLATLEDNGDTQPLKTYNLSVLAEGSKQGVKIDPPATKMTVKVEIGQGSIRCGDANQTYNCAPGKPINISYEPSEAVSQFWGENQSEHQYRLRIDVYEVAGVGKED
ncbi:MAG: hypothetical protein AAGF26_03975 [Cyanobacteria bacterium P01_G01_bin.49]